MTVEELATLVAAMRTAQKDYFRTRETRVLSESKRLEREVDAAIKQVLAKQGTML